MQIQQEHQQQILQQQQLPQQMIQQPADQLGHYLGSFLRNNAPRISRFFLDLHMITEEYVKSVSPYANQMGNPPPFFQQQHAQFYPNQQNPPYFQMGQGDQFQGVIDQNLQLENNHQQHQQPHHENHNQQSNLMLKPKKKKADRNRPANQKKPVTPFFLFMLEMKDKIKESHMCQKGNDVTVHAGELWRGLPDSEKDAWRIKALKRAEELGQETNFEYLKVINPDSKKRRRSAKTLQLISDIAIKNNPEEMEFDSTLSDHNDS